MRCVALDKALVYREDIVHGDFGSVSVKGLTNAYTANSGGSGMDLKDYLRLLRNRFPWIVLMTLVGIAISGGITLGMTPVYSAKATLFVTVQSSQDTAYARSQYAMQRVSSYPQLINDPKVLKEVISKLDLNISYQELKDSLSASNPVDTVLISVTATASTGETAADIANVAAPLLGEQISALENSEPEKLLVTPVLSVPATEPLYPIAPRKSINLALGLIAGLSLGLVVALLVDKLDPRILRVKDVELKTALPVLGVVRGRNGIRKKPQMENDYRRLISNLLMANDGHLPRRILVLSDTNTESIDAVELATTLAAIGKKAIIVDGDDTWGNVDSNDSNEPGLIQVLEGSAVIEEAVVIDEQIPMALLPAGNASGQLRQYDVYRGLEPLISELEIGYDVVIILTKMEAKPVDGAAVAMHCDCILLTCTERRTTFGKLRRALDDLAASKVGATGIVVLSKKSWLARFGKA